MAVGGGNGRPTARRVLPAETGQGAATMNRSGGSVRGKIIDVRARFAMQFVDQAAAGMSRVAAPVDGVVDQGAGAAAHSPLAPPRPTAPVASDAAVGAAALSDEPPPGELIAELDHAGRPSNRALAAMQQLTSSRVREEITTPQAALKRFREIADGGIDNLNPEELRVLHALLEELPAGLRVPRAETTPSRLAHAAAELQRYPTGNVWFLGAGPSQVVRARALDAMPDKKLVADSLQESATGEYCTLGAVGASRGMDMGPLELIDASGVAKAFNIAHALAAEIMYMNDDEYDYRTPELRWSHMRNWITSQIKESS